MEPTSASETVGVEGVEPRSHLLKDMPSSSLVYNLTQGPWSALCDTAIPNTSASKLSSRTEDCLGRGGAKAPIECGNSLAGRGRPGSGADTIKAKDQRSPRSGRSPSQALSEPS